MTQYIQIAVTLIIAIWNFYLQTKLKKIEFKNKQLEIKSNKITDFEYSSYKEIWRLAISTINKARFLRAYPIKTSTELIEQKEVETLLIQKIKEFDIAIKEFDSFLLSNSPFIHKEIRDIFRQMISIGKLEFYQSFSTGHSINAMHMEQALLNLKKMDSLLDDAEDKMRQLIIDK